MWLATRTMGMQVATQKVAIVDWYSPSSHHGFSLPCSYVPSSAFVTSLPQLQGRSVKEKQNISTYKQVYQTQANSNNKWHHLKVQDSQTLASLNTTCAVILLHENDHGESATILCFNNNMHGFLLRCQHNSRCPIFSMMKVKRIAYGGWVVI